MNERIKELAKQAGLFVDLNNQPYPRAMSAEECQVAYEKFAELIVAECAKICASRVGNSDYNTGRMHCASDIKEYFDDDRNF